MIQLSSTVASANWSSSGVTPAAACNFPNGTLVNGSSCSNANPPFDMKLFAAQFSYLPFLGCGILQRVNAKIWNADPLLCLTYALISIVAISSNVLGWWYLSGLVLVIPYLLRVVILWSLKCLQQREAKGKETQTKQEPSIENL